MPENSSELIGRSVEVAQLKACLGAKRNLLVEGPVGVGKTHLVSCLVAQSGRSCIRVDGDSRYTEQKLTGWFDPPSVLKSGYSDEAFFDGPLTKAMKAGSILFINELNRMPEGVQNILLPAIDEKRISIPKLRDVVAKDGFLVVATQNPKEFVATTHLSEAILDRFELVSLDYQSEEEERQIIFLQMEKSAPLLGLREKERLARTSVRLIRMTRDDPRVSRGASVRAALSVAEITVSAMGKKDHLFEENFAMAALMALPTRIELSQNEGVHSHAPGQEQLRSMIKEWVQVALSEKDVPSMFSPEGSDSSKKKN